MPRPDQQYVRPALLDAIATLFYGYADAGLGYICDDLSPMLASLPVGRAVPRWSVKSADRRTGAHLSGYE